MNCIKDSYIFTYYVNDSSDEFYKTFIAGVEDKIKDVKNFVKHSLVDYLNNDDYISKSTSKRWKERFENELKIYNTVFNYTKEQLINLINKFIDNYFQNETERDRILRLFDQELYGNGDEICKFICDKLSFKYTEDTVIWFDTIYDDENQDFDYFEFLNLNTKEDMKNWKHRWQFDHFRTLAYCVIATKTIVNKYNIKTKEEMNNIIYELIKEFVLTC